jgi:thioredoxin 2
MPSTFTTTCPNCHGKNRVPTERFSEHPKCGKCQAQLVDGAPIEGTIENLSAFLDSNLPVVIDFWAPWCNPCVDFSPIYEDIAKEFTDKARFLKIDTEAQQQLAAQYQIRSIPTIMVFKNGQRVDMINGALPKSQFEQWLDHVINQ